MAMRRWVLAAAIAAAIAALPGCAVPSPEARGARILAWVSEQAWRPLLLPGPVFDLQAFVPASLHGAHRLTIYIEGDGLAWVDRHTPSLAPTPADPLALRLAVADAGGASVYLGRPCQYTRGEAFKGCDERYWGSHRFAPEVIDAMDHAVDQMKRAYGASTLVLVGYSGGAAVAALLADRRHDVAALVTVAGTLDTDLWTRQQHLSPLQGSLNPRGVAARLAQMPQWHFIGQQDRVVPGSVLQSYLDAAGRAGQGTPAARVHAEPGFDHHCCWGEAWPVLSRRFQPVDGRR